MISLDEYVLKPKVDETQEFIEIANDFSNPLEIVRESISNSFDAKAKKIEIIFDVVDKYGEKNLQIKLKDNGNGMDEKGLQSFFDLGNSLRRNDSNTIGEKGHGTKVYFNSSEIKIITTQNGITLKAYVDEPYKNLFDRKIPEVRVNKEITPNIGNGTEIIIIGYNKNRRDKFTHEILKDYILWYTKFGSIEKSFGMDNNKNVELYLKGLNREKPEKLLFGHVFPDDSLNVQKLFDMYMVKAPNYYCKKIIKAGQLKNFPEINYEAIFSVEGNKVKQDYNKMLRRRGYQAPEGAYTVQERYGLWLCKDYIPIQRKNEWITKKGSEYTKFHAFFNCQDFKLTANRGSVENTPSEIMEDIKIEIEKIYSEIINGDEWRELEWLENEAESYHNTEKEEKDFVWRTDRINKANIARYKNLTLIKPQRESGVYSIIIQLLTIEPDLFPFEIVDYDTHSGIDVIVKGDKTNPIYQSKLYYLEFKYYLEKQFNHSFKNLHSVICWDTNIKNDEIIEDINKDERKMTIVRPNKQGEYTRYYLDTPKSAHKIEVYVLKDYLREKLNLEFRPRTKEDIV